MKKNNKKVAYVPRGSSGVFGAQDYWTYDDFQALKIVQGDSIDLEVLGRRQGLKHVWSMWNLGIRTRFMSWGASFWLRVEKKKFIGFIIFSCRLVISFTSGWSMDWDGEQLKVFLPWPNFQDHSSFAGGGIFALSNVICWDIKYVCHPSNRYWATDHFVGFVMRWLKLQSELLIHLENLTLQVWRLIL